GWRVLGPVDEVLPGRLLGALFGDEKPGDEVEGDPEPVEDGEGGEDEADDQRVDAEVFSQPSGHPRDPPLRPAAPARTPRSVRLAGGRSGRRWSRRGAGRR